MTTLPSQLTSDRLTLGSMKAMGCSPRTTLSLWDLMMMIDDGYDDDDGNDEPNHLMMTELLLRLRAGLPVSELPRRRHSAMIEQNVRIWSHTEYYIRMDSEQRQNVLSADSSPRGRRMPSRQ